MKLPARFTARTTGSRRVAAQTSIASIWCWNSTGPKVSQAKRGLRPGRELSFVNGRDLFIFRLNGKRRAVETPRGGRPKQSFKRTTPTRRGDSYETVLVD